MPASPPMQKTNKFLSIEAQITELRAYAKQEKLEVVEELIEKQSAKIPGRPIFNEMLSRIESGEADSITIQTCQKWLKH